MPCTTIHAMLNSSCTARKTNLGRTQLLSHIEELLRRSASECSKYFRDLRNQQGCAVSKVILHAAPSRGVKTKKHVLWDSIRHHEHPNTLPWLPLLSLSWLSKRKRFIPRPCS